MWVAITIVLSQCSKSHLPSNFNDKERNTPGFHRLREIHILAFEMVQQGFISRPHLKIMSTLAKLLSTCVDGASVYMYVLTVLWKANLNAKHIKGILHRLVDEVSHQ